MKITKKYLKKLIVEEIRGSLQKGTMAEVTRGGPSSLNQFYDRIAPELNDCDHKIAQLRSELDQVKREMESLATALELLQGY